MNEYPKILETFKKNCPTAKFSNLYVCESVDMDGNVIETKIGKNIVTNYGLPTAVDGIIYSNTHMALGNGYAISDPDNIDPYESALKAYLSDLGFSSDHRDRYVTEYPIEYDSQTHLMTQSVRGGSYMWDYTDGNNATYEATEFGINYYETYSNENMLVHARVYDENGNLSSITKRPNTRLYITSFFTYAVNIDLINQLYQQKIYFMCSPLIATNDAMGKYYSNMYAIPLSSGYMYDVGSRDAPCITKNWERITTDDGRSLLSRTIDTGQSYYFISIFFENNRWYCTGFYYGNADDGYRSHWENFLYDTSLIENSRRIIFSYNELPSTGYDTIKNIESKFVAVNNSHEFTQSGTVNQTENILSLKYNFGSCNQDDHDRNYYGRIPCSQFDISSLMMYNYDTHAWDIPVGHINAPLTRYNNSHWKLGLKLKVTYGGVTKNVCIFTNPYTQYTITGFENTGIGIVATDAYWDTTTWSVIPNLTNIPSELRNKRYYIITDGDHQALRPKYDITTRPIHRIAPPIEPYEMTANGCPLNKEPADLYYGSIQHSSITNIRFNPISSDKYSYFFTSADLIYYDIENKELKASYPLVFDNDTYPNGLFRYKTEQEDRIIAAKIYRSSPYSNPSGSSIDNGVSVLTNEFRIWTVGDYDVQPTAVDIKLEWSIPFTDGNNDPNIISFSDIGYMCIQRHSGINEGAFIDVYNGTQHIISSNCDKLWALNRTSHCVYQDLDATTGTNYVFNVYDMETKQIIDTFSINTGVTYTIHGVVGWRNYIYIQTSDTAQKTVFMYDTNAHELTATTLDMCERLDNDKFGQNYSWMTTSIYSTDDILVIGGYCGYYTRLIPVIRYTDPTHTMDLSESYYGDLFRSNLIDQTQIKRCKNGHALILLNRQPGSPAISHVINLGEVFDEGIKQYPPDQLYLQTTDGHNEWACIDGCAMLYKDGIILVSATQNSALRNRIFYIPIECMSTFKITGTTDNINAYNNPVRFSGLNISHKMTNDLNRIINGDT